MAENLRLRARLAEDDRALKQHELAEALNEALRLITGKRGTVSDRHIRNLLSGKTRWPHEPLRMALEAVLGCPVTELGFSPPPSRARAHQDRGEEDPVQDRRKFLATTGVAIAITTTPAAAMRRTIGASDAERLRQAVSRLDHDDKAIGGVSKLETLALRYADRALELVNSGTAASRVRSMLYSVAADATATAAWICIDGRRPDEAADHLNTAGKLAGLAQDKIAEFRIWNFHSMLSGQSGRRTDALAAAESMQKAARGDALYVSLAHARKGFAHAALGEHTAAMRSFERARTSFDRVDPETPRPEWISFYGKGEIEGLTAVAALTLGRPAEAEYHAYRALAYLPEALRRNRALYYTELAFAQLRQGDDERAIATAHTAEQLGGNAPGSARFRIMITDFRTELAATANGTAARSYAHTYR
ncbi:hypothetical protein I5Q34_34035 [Streptomyces sp. AV19]|uniref:hypothetical protein n=1 Tax=Streptomyces sp. AV19 TaxID=2793068 RepID=UPI0018FEFFF2|nr:hypothetical protein [Streptomyces sp. AV19]MBH1939221.1 hypothetical protein [Streptomyces sp. AV19]MDG4537197.1 hypothetical protein [Streptomyces sp. AV19]